MAKVGKNLSLPIDYFAETNECSCDPCQNGGQCIDGLNFYLCICPSGYSGVNCENEDDGGGGKRVL